MIVDGAKLLELVKDNKFEDGEEIRPQITTNAIYVYSAYYRNFTDKKTGNQLTVQEYIFWTFDIPKDKEETDIQAMEELDLYAGYKSNVDKEIIGNRIKINELIKAVKQLDKNKVDK